MATQIDLGKRMTARLPGTCEECRRRISPGDAIYFSRDNGARHQACVDRGPEEQDPDRRSRSFHRGGRENDGATERKRDGENAFDRDTTRRELGQVLDLLIESLQRIRKLLT